MMSNTKQRFDAMTPNGILKFVGLQLLETSANRLLTAPTILAFSAGLALGASGGLIFAPQSGRKTRKMVRRLFKKAGIAAAAKVEDGVEAVADGVRDLTDLSAKKPNGRHRSDGPRVEVATKL